LSDEQRLAVEHLTDARGSIKIVSGMAGTGKTTMLQSAREVWKGQGFQVQGVALAAAAAKGLEDEAKISSRTIAKLFYSIDNPQQDEGPRLNNRTVLVIDEAGMVGTLQMARLVDEAEKAGAKLAMVGDAEQLQPIEHGAPFKVFGHLLGKAELQQIRRQREEWQREAAHDFASGRAIEGLTKYQERGLLTITEKRADAVRQLVDAWSKDSSDYRDKIMMASTRAAVNELNRLGQQSRIDRGELGAESVKVNGYDFYAGDRILFRKNDKRLGVLNGEKATVKEIDAKSETLIARMDGGELRMIPLRRYEQVQLGYAFTTHAEQGDTREKSFVLVGGSMQDRELSYVQMTRHRAEAHIFTSVEDAGKSLETLAEVMNRSRQKELAQEKRERGIEIAPAMNRESREETAWAEGKPAAEQHRQQAAQAEPWFVSILAEDRRKVGDVVKALERIADVSGEMRHNSHAHSEERAKEISAWVRYGQPIAEKLSGIPGLPLDAEIKGTLTETLKSLHWMTRAYEHGQGHREYVFQSMNTAREALRKVQPDLLTWELARSVSHSNGNFQIIAKMIEQGGRVENLWQHGGHGEHNLSVFTVRNLPGTYTAHRHGMDKTSMSFDDRVNKLGYSDPPDSSKVKEVEYDPIEIRAEQMQQERAQARQIEQGQEQSRDSGGYGYSR
jgi:AAA domain